DIVYMIYLVYNAAVLHRISYSNVAVMRGTANRTKDCLKRFSDTYSKMQEISLYVEKMQAFLTIEPEIVSNKDKCLPLPTAPREIELKNVSFGYNQREGYILRNINMKIDPCNKIATVGYNRAGKNNLI
ncbi:MAG: ABC transporter ATP-binding protein, partial [Ruminiclostridium sp.]|nr:ABC transporter ATP-binding protein [Ruminiclostridium sp.]